MRANQAGRTSRAAKLIGLNYHGYFTVLIYSILTRNCPMGKVRARDAERRRHGSKQNMSIGVSGMDEWRDVNAQAVQQSAERLAVQADRIEFHWLFNCVDIQYPNPKLPDGESPSSGC